MARPSLSRLVVYTVVVASLVHSMLSSIRLLTREAPTVKADNSTSLQISRMNEWLMKNLHLQGKEISEPSSKLLQAGFLSLLHFLDMSKVLPFKTQRYPQTKGVLDRLPMEQFMRQVSSQKADIRFVRCLEWGPFFKGWRGTTQPYLKLFNCSRKWMFSHHPSSGSIESSIKEGEFGSVKGDVDLPLSQQGLGEIEGFFDLVIFPQTLQYAQNPQQAVRVLFQLLAPGGILLITCPSVQITLPYEIHGSNKQSDYWRFTIEGVEHLLTSAGFKIEDSYIGGDRLSAIVWLLEGGQTDLENLDRGHIMKKGKDYSHPAYMITLNVARKPM